MDFTYRYRSTWITLLLWIVLLQKRFSFVSGQACDNSSSKPQCSTGQICKQGSCIAAESCDGGGGGCNNDPGFTCVADYCQPETCTTTGQCVHGQICSQNENSKTCVYPVKLNVAENTKVVLNFTDPGSGGPYEEITWSKERTGSSTYRIVFVHPTATGGKLQYYHDYCSGSSPCNESTKVELNIDTGELTVNEVQFSDEDFYYYDFHINGGSTGTGIGQKYEIQIEVYVVPQQNDLTLKGIISDYVEVGKELDLTCTMSRIKPRPADMYWMIGEQRKNGSVSLGINNDGTFSESNMLKYKVAKEDEGKTIRCIVRPVYGNILSKKQTINPGYGPSGKPDVDPTSLSKHVNETVRLTCVNPSDDGNPACDMYTWNRIEGSNGISLPASKKLVFKMEESRAGNYTCTCGNQYNTSDFSNIAEVILLAGSAPTDASSGVSMAIIGGAVGGAVVVILVVVIAIFLMRRRKKPSKSQPSEPVYAEMQQTSHSDDEMGRSPQRNGSAEPLYAQPSKRKLRPQRGIDHGPQYENTEKLRKESPYENTKIDNNNPPSKQENGNPDGVVYTEVNIGKDGKPRPKERNSIKKKVHQQEEPTVYAEIVPGGKSGETK